MVWYITLLGCGLFLVGVEIFLPGGVVGLLGAVALIGAAVTGFMIFPPVFGWLSLALIFLLTGLAAFVWIRCFPGSPVGRALALSQKIGKKDQDDAPWKVGMRGTALSALRPAGKAFIEETRADVIAEDGIWIEPRAALEVIRVAGNRIYVRERKIES